MTPTYLYITKNSTWNNEKDSAMLNVDSAACVGWDTAGHRLAYEP